MTFRPFVSMICAVLILQGCAVSSTNQVVKPGENKGGFMGLSKNPEVMITNGDTLKGLPKKVIIGSFKVGFLTDTKASAAAKGGFFSTNANAGHASAAAHLKGLTVEDMTKATNEIYQSFVQELQSKGFTVVTADELAKDSTYSELHNASASSVEEGVVLNIAQESKTTYAAPQGMKLVYFIGEKKALMDLSTETIKKMQALNETSGAAVLAVNYLINFVGVDAQGGWTSSASVQVGQGLKIGWGNITVYNGKNKAPSVIKLGQPVYSDKEFCTIEKTTSAAAKTLGTAVNIASAFLGGGTSQSETFDFHADPQKYISAAKDVSMQVNGKLITKLTE